MTINWAKTKIMFFTKKHIAFPSKLLIFGAEVEVVNTFKLLGVTIDSNLDFHQYIENIKATINRKLFSFKRLFFPLLLNKTTIFQILYSFTF